MNSKTGDRRTVRFSLANLIAAGAACAMMAAVVPPGLEQLRQRMEPVTCANNLRASHQGWNVYGSEHNGVWMAPWGRTNKWWDYEHTSQLSGNIVWVQMYPYTMVQYVAGGGIPAGETVYMFGRPGGPWYAPDGNHGFPPEYCSSPNDAPQLQCETTVAKGSDANPTWYNATSYSYAIMGGRRVGDIVVYDANGYPTPGLMTHPSTTILLSDLSGIHTEGASNAWSIYEGFYTDPHSDKSNYVFCDGHVELLDQSELNAEMWQSLWTPDQ